MNLYVGTNHEVAHHHQSSLIILDIEVDMDDSFDFLMSHTHSTQNVLDHTLDSTDRAPALENLPQQKQHSTDDAVDRGIDVHHLEGTLVVASQDVTGKGITHG